MGARLIRPEASWAAAPSQPEPEGAGRPSEPSGDAHPDASRLREAPMALRTAEPGHGLPLSTWRTNGEFPLLLPGSGQAAFGRALPKSAHQAA